MKKHLFVLLMLSCRLFLSAQTGPAGVGTPASNVFWLKADEGTSSTVNNTRILTWSDQSGNGLDVTQPVAVQQPSFATNIINGFPAVQFDNNGTSGQNDKMIGPDSPLLDNTNGYTFFTVTRPQNFGDAHVIVSKRTTVSVDQSFMLFYYTSNKLHVDVQTTNDRFNSNTAFAANTNYIIDLVYDGTIANPRCRLYVGESLDISANETSAFVPDNASPIILGTTDASDPRPYGGYMSEIIIYREALAPVQRIIVNNYLSAKYDIALSANDKYTGDNAGNGNYDREVAGIGQESTGSSTSFSSSISGGMGITAISGLGNGDYILAGHASATNSQINTDVGGMTGASNARWQRIWYMDVTNASTSINANIEFSATDGGTGSAPLGTTASDYVLLYRPGQSGNWTELATASSVAGDRAFFNNITLNNDGYYTIGTKNSVNSVLPIELINFEAVVNNAKVELAWSTASEKDNAFFTIEKTTDGNSFETVATHKGSGNSSARINYTSEDLHPNKGLSYYRLKQSDFTGVASYSKLVAVNYGTTAGTILIYPNPSNGLIYISGLPEGQAVHVEITDNAGKRYFTKTVNVEKSSQALAVDTENKLPKGAYIISITAADKTQQQKIIFK